MQQIRVGKVRIVSNRRKMCEQVKILQDIDQDGKADKEITIDVRELLGIVGAYVLAGVLVVEGQYEAALAVAGPVSGYAIGRST